MSELLPRNATTLERKLADTAADALDGVLIPLRDFHDPAKCAPELLPFLAWERSVDRWDSTWSVGTKRAVTVASYFVHRKKGTIGALRRVVEPLGFLIRVIEWHETNPPGPRGTFKLDIGVLDTGISEAMYQELERLIDDAKPVSRHLTGLAISMEVRGSVYQPAVALLGDELTVYPYTPEDIVVSGALASRGAAHIVDTLTVSQ